MLLYVSPWEKVLTAKFIAFTSHFQEPLLKPMRDSHSLEVSLFLHQIRAGQIDESVVSSLTGSIHGGLKGRNHKLAIQPEDGRR